LEQVAWAFPTYRKISIYLVTKTSKKMIRLETSPEKNEDESC